jgi:CDP-diacylglycerol---serine O-phosphatidyltransferase
LVLFVALLISYPWEVLTLATLAYLAGLPFGWMSYRRLERAAAGEAPADAATPSAEAADRAGAPAHREPNDGERPARLN